MEQKLRIKNVIFRWKICVFIQKVFIYSINSLFLLLKCFELEQNMKSLYVCI